MPWVRLDDHIDEHPKIAALSDSAFAVFIAGLAYANRNLTNGFIPSSVGFGQLRFCEGNAVPAVRELEAVGLWEQTPGGWKIHDYRDYQPSKRQVLAERRATRKRVARLRGKRIGNVDCNAPSNAESNAPSNAVSTPSPVPVPVPKKDQGLRPFASSTNGKRRRPTKRELTSGRRDLALTVAQESAAADAQLARAQIAAGIGSLVKPVPSVTEGEVRAEAGRAYGRHLTREERQ